MLMFAGVLSDRLCRVFWLTKSSVFVGVAERGCFLEEEDSASLLSNFWMMVTILAWRNSRVDCCLVSLVGRESNCPRESSTCSWRVVWAACMVVWEASRVVFFSAS